MRNLCLEEMSSAGSQLNRAAALLDITTVGRILQPPVDQEVVNYRGFLNTTALHQAAGSEEDDPGEETTVKIIQLLLDAAALVWG